MSGDWRSEVIIIGFTILNLTTVALGLVWAWRRRAMFGRQGQEVPGLGPDELPARETRNG
jgi:hypothetical protein